MKHLFYDTCFYIDLFQGKVDPAKIEIINTPLLIIGNTVVFMELYQGVRNLAEEQAIHDLKNSLTLISPSGKNYLDAGPILKKMSDRGWISFKNLYAMQNDVLLSLSAIEHSSAIVTRNRKDFEKINQFCPVNVFYY